jgi:DNA mismatch repair protein PMS2
LDTLEISDNGSGIDEKDWDFIGKCSTLSRNVVIELMGLGLKHHTSKLPSLADLPHVTTFGFRGEALASLCALCESVTVTTSTEGTAPMGTIIKLGRDGRVLDASTRVARPVS